MESLYTTLFLPCVIRSKFKFIAVGLSLNWCKREPSVSDAKKSPFLLQYLPLEFR
jgi:hypothetical protein